VGINPLKQKMLAFVVGAAIAGMIGVCSGHYNQIMCPTDLSFATTTTLLIMLFVGGVGSLRGITMGAILFTVIPEVLRLAPQLRLLLYGIILLLVTLYMPGGLESAIARVWKRDRSLT
jgi:ABC-type branched-subunit amino acid transport system permease subunit